MEAGAGVVDDFAAFAVAFRASASAVGVADADKKAPDVTTEQWKLVIAFTQPRLCQYGLLAKVARVVYGVDAQAIKKRVLGNDFAVTRTGPPPALGIALEREMATFAAASARAGVALTAVALRETALHIAERASSTQKLPSTIKFGRKWTERFLLRHSELGSRTGQLMDTSRATAVNPANVERYVQIANAVLSARKPGTPIYVMDEKPLPHGDKAQSQRSHIGVVGEPCNVLAGSTGGHASFVGCITPGLDEWLLPTVIHSGKRPLASLMTGAGDVRLMMDDSGYMSKACMLAYAALMIEKLSPGVLFMDNYYSHRDPEVLAMFWAGGWDVVLFAPHTTHLACPLDVVKYRQFEAAYQAALDARRATGVCPGRNDVAACVLEACLATSKPGGNVNAFRRAGLEMGSDGRYTLRPDFVPETAFLPAKLLFQKTDELLAAAGLTAPVRTNTLKLTPEDVAKIKAEVLAQRTIVPATVAKLTGEATRRQRAEYGTCLELIQREADALEAKQAEVVAKGERKEARLAKKAAKEAAKAATPKGGPRKAGKRKRSAVEEDEEDEEEEDVEEELGDGEQVAEGVPAAGEEKLCISDVRGHEWVGKGKKKLLHVRVKWVHLDEAANTEHALQPLANFEWTAADGRVGYNSLVADYLKDNLTDDERTTVGL